MKNAKWVLFSVLILGICSGYAFAQPNNAGVGISIRAEFQGTNTIASVAHAGDVLDYIVTVRLDINDFNVTDGEPCLVLPNGTLIDLDDNLALSSGGSIAYDPAGTYIVDENDLGSLPGANANEVRALATVSAISHVPGTLQDVTATTNFDVTVLEVCVDVDKTAEPTVSKEGDEVLYTIVITNCGDALIDAVSIEDTLLGSLMGLNIECNELAAGEHCTIEDVPYTVLADDNDPLINVVEVNYADRVGGPDAHQHVTATDDAIVDLVDPNLEVIKNCPDFSKPGDTIDYSVTITNTSNDANLIILSVIDSLAGELDDCDGLLEIGQQCVIDYNYVVPADACDPLINEVNVVTQVQGLPNILTELAACEADLVHPAFTVVKDCLTDPVVGDTAQFRITIQNTGDVNLIITSDESPELSGPLPLPVDQNIVVDINRPVAPGATEVNNSIQVTATLPAETGLDNRIIHSASATCAVPGLEGCTPGFWKNHHECWDCFDPCDTLGSVFTIPGGTTYNGLAAKKLKEALAFPGGSSVKAKAQILLRAAVSALLNACDPNIDYPLTVAGVIEEVNTALELDSYTQAQLKAKILELAGTLDEYNNLGCPIDAHCNVIEDDDIIDG